MTLIHAALKALLLATPDAGPDAERSWVDRERCPPHIELRALGSVSSAPRDWKILRHHFRKFGHCDAGALAEGYSHGVVTLLAHRWELIDELVTVSRDDGTFLQFVLAHIDATTAHEDLRLVQARAESECPPRQRKLCLRIAEQARSALDQHGSAAR